VRQSKAPSGAAPGWLFAPGANRPPVEIEAKLPPVEIETNRPPVEIIPPVEIKFAAFLPPVEITSSGNSTSDGNND